MPRSSGGTYTLYTPGNPVVTNTVISSTWANNTLTDLATAMTDSLSRSGQGAMLAPLQLNSGSAANPGLTWANETTAGLYRAGAGDFRYNIGGTEIFRFWSSGAIGKFADAGAAAPSITFLNEASGFYRAGALDIRLAIAAADLLQMTPNILGVFGTAPSLRLQETDAAANNKYWDIIATGEDMAFRALTDAFAATNFLVVSRTGGTIDRVTVQGTLFDSPSNVQFTRQGTGSTPSTASVAITSGAPIFVLNETAASANNRLWAISAQSESMLFRAWDDAGGSFNTFLQVDRTSTTIDTVNFPTGTLNYAGLEIGYKNLVDNIQNGNYTIQTSDKGRMVSYGGAGGHTYTLPNLGADSIVTIRNGGSGNLTLAGSGVTLQWYNGSGTISTGSRTLAVGGIAVMRMDGTTAANVWGVGLT